MADKQKYIVTVPWHGVEEGQVVEFEKVPKALKANVKPYNAKHKVDDNALADAQAEAEKIKAAATEEADKIKADAQAEAEKMISEAEKQAGELTPATPEAGTKSETKAATKK